MTAVLPTATAKNTLPPRLRAISSMATKALLAQLCAAFERDCGVVVAVESVGGVDAAKRVAAGERFDVVLLASDAIDRLIVAGHLVASSRVDWVNSAVAVAVPVGQALDVSSEAALKQAVIDAPSLCYSTGPSGNYLAQLFERWGITREVQAKLTVPPPGVGVASLIARGQVSLGFQQRSELLGVAGVSVVGDLPPGCAFVTTFSAGLAPGLGVEQTLVARAFLSFLNAPENRAAKQALGMMAV